MGGPPTEGGAGVGAGEGVGALAVTAGVDRAATDGPPAPIFFGSEGSAPSMAAASHLLRSRPLRRAMSVGGPTGAAGLTGTGATTLPVAGGGVTGWAGAGAVGPAGGAGNGPRIKSRRGNDSMGDSFAAPAGPPGASGAAGGGAPPLTLTGIGFGPGTAGVVGGRTDAGGGVGLIGAGTAPPPGGSSPRLCGPPTLERRHSV